MSIIFYVCIGVMAAVLVSAVGLLLKVDNSGSRAAISDMIFYSMIAVYLLWSLLNESRIAYEVALLAGLVAGLSTISLARILSNGRR